MKKLAIVLLVVLLVVMGCSKEEEKVEPAKKEVKKEEPAVKEQPKAEEKKEPVQTLSDDVEPVFQEKPVAVMLDNHWNARPQSGLSLAKVLYEVLAEGRITRMMMVTDAQKGTVGPIRSARPYFVRFVMDWKALYGRVGGSTEGDRMVSSLGIGDLDQFWVGSKAYWRESHRSAPHNMYADIEKLRNVAKEAGYEDQLQPGQQYPFNTYKEFHPLTEGKDVNSAAFSYYHDAGVASYDVSFTYNKEKNTYTKSYSKTVLVDEATKNPVEGANVIIQVAPHSIHSNGKHKVIATVGEGKGFYLTGGKLVEITWSKADDTSPTKYKVGDKELVVNPGLTFINVIEEDMEVTFE